MSQTADVIVIGGGIIGLSAAIAMRQRGFSVSLLDAGSLMVDVSIPDLRVYALNPSSIQLFQALGVWDAIDKTRISSYNHMHVWDAKSGAHIDFDARMISASRLGVIVEQSVIKQVLLQTAAVLGVHIVPQCNVTHVDVTADSVTIGSGMHSRWQSQLLMVADGVASTTRQLLDVNVTDWSYHQHAIVSTVRTEMPHRQTAYQVFNSDGPLAFLPLVDQHQCSIVWSTSPRRADYLMTLSDDVFARHLTEAFSAKLGDIAVIAKRMCFPLHMRHVQRYTGPRWLLMGDAAHTIHPLAGLGLNVGLADLRAWLVQLDTHRYPIGSSKRLGAYQRQRKYMLWQTIALMEGLKTLFANPLPPIVALRGFGLSMCNKMPLIKRLLIEHASGVDFVAPVAPSA